MKNKTSVFKKLFLFILAVYVILGLILGISAQRYIQSSNVDFFANELKSSSRIILPLVRNDILQKNYKSLNERVKRLSSDSGKRITVIDPSGKVLADSDSDAATMQNHANREEIKSVIEGMPFAQSIRHSGTLEKDMLYLAVPVRHDGKLSAVLRLSVPVTKISLFTHQIFKNMIFIFIAAALLALAAAFYISRRMSLNIRAVSEAASKIASGDFSARADVDSNDEVGALADTFNDMSKEIAGLFGEVKRSNDMLDKILSSVSEAVLLTDESGKILTFNDIFKSIYDNVSQGRYYWEFLRDKVVDLAFNAVKSGAEHSVSGEMEIEGKIYYYYVSKVKSDNQFIITLSDVSKIKQLDNLKKDFITNASHELKTPVTSIIGFAETLESEKLPQESARYVEIIKKQAQRLSNIVNDLLSLSMLENAADIDKKAMSVASIIENVVSLYGKKVSEKGIKINVSVDGKLNNIYANEFNMEQLWTNIIDNAVKYTEKGEISVSAQNDGDFVKVTISDTGIGIPKELTERIFERFFVVDKSRSRKSGGTGLGLSIVKHIVNTHGGSILVDSREGQGTTFTIKLPAYK